MSVEVIYNTTIIPPALYSFQKVLLSSTAYASNNSSIYDYAALGVSLGSPPVLYSNGCMVNGGTWNCTEACQDVNQIFSSVYTLQNCLEFPQMSSLLANGSLTQAARTTALEAGIDESSYNVSSAVYDIITGCLHGWCAQNSKCRKTGGTDKYCYHDVYGSRLCFMSPCYDIDVSLNPDIGGVGVRFWKTLQEGSLAYLFFH